MADECVLVKETELPIPFSCSSSTAIEKGSVCKLSNSMTASLSTGDVDSVAGIVQSGVLSTNAGKVSIYRGGIFRGVAGTSGVTAGTAIVTDSSTSGSNRFVSASVGAENLVGIAFETATSGNEFLFELKPVVVNLA